MGQTNQPLPLLPLFSSFIAASKSNRRQTASKKKFAAGTLEQYQCVYKLLAAYELKYHITLRLELVKKHSVTALQKQKRYWSCFFKTFCRFLYSDKGCLDTYVAAVFKVLRTFFNYLSKDKHLPIGNFHHLFRSPTPIYTPLVLEPCQLQFLIQDLPFDQALPRHLQRTKDIFVFGCTVALRYSDLMALRKEQVIQSPSGAFLQVHTQKTGVMVKLPLPAYLMAILEKHHKKAGRYLLPRLSNVNFNLQVKDLMERAGWTYTLPKVRHRMGRPVELKSKTGESLRFCDQVSAHTMRRTAITTLLMLGVPEQAVRRISGHAPGSREFYRYIALAEDYVQGQVRRAYEKLLEPAEKQSL
jgi:integrase